MVSLSERINNYYRHFRLIRQQRQIEKFRKENEVTKRFSDTSKHIIICGEPRGGTTWLSEVLYSEGRFVVWEALHPRSIKNYKVKNFADEIGLVPYIPQGAHWPEAVEYFKALLSGAELNYESVAGFAKANYDFDSINGLIFKFCRADMLLPWLVDNFNINPIYLVRHPLAVISSMIRHHSFENIDVRNHMFNRMTTKYSDIFERYKGVSKYMNTREEMLAHWWCISNVVPLTHAYNNKKWITVAYESLLTRPEFELDRLSKRLNINFPGEIFDKLSEPSATTKTGSGILTGENQLLNWKKYLTTRQIDTILSVCYKYGIDAYSLAAEPDYSKLGYEC